MRGLGSGVGNPLRVQSSTPSRHCSRCRSGRSVAAPLHVASRHCSRCRSGRSVAAPLLAPLLPLPVWAQRRGTPTRATAPAAGLGAASRHPYSRHCSRCRSGRSVAAPLLAPLLPLPVWAQRRGTPTRATAPAAGLGAASRHPSMLSSHVQRATFNLQPLALRASRLAPLNGILPHIYATTCATV